MKSLKELIQANEPNLRDELAGIPMGSDKDIIEVFNRIVSSNIDNGTYKDELTINEMAIFQSLVEVVRTSIGIVEMSQTSTHHSSISTPKEPTDVDNKNKFLDKFSLSKAQWGIVGATITGFATGLYPTLITVPIMVVVNSVLGWYISKNKEPNVECMVATEEPAKQLNVEHALDKIYDIADCIDNAMNIYTTNVHNIIAEHTSQTPLTLSTQYGYLLDRLRDLYSVKNEDEQKEALKHLRKTMANYGYEILEYSEENSDYFNVRESEYVTELYVESLALVEQGHCIQKGTVFVPKK